MKQTQKQRILARAAIAQRNGDIGDAIKLRMLASEIKTIRYGREQPHPDGPL